MGVACWLKYQRDLRCTIYELRFGLDCVIVSASAVRSRIWSRLELSLPDIR
jgi:hypothetical protein